MMNNWTQPQQNLAQVNEATLMALSQQGNPGFTHAALLEQSRSATTDAEDSRGKEHRSA